MNNKELLEAANQRWNANKMALISAAAQTSGSVFSTEGIVNKAKKLALEIAFAAPITEKDLTGNHKEDLEVLLRPDQDKFMNAAWKKEVKILVKGGMEEGEAECEATHLAWKETQNKYPTLKGYGAWTT